MVTTNNNMPAFCLKLNSHQTHVIDAFQKLYNDELLVDCTLSCSGGTLKAHKIVLSACSPYFTSLFSNFTNPNQYPIIILKDMPFQDLKLIIEFMYRGEITVPQNLLPSILESAKALMITGLREIKVANIETGKSTETTSKSSRRNRKRRHKTNDSLESSGGESDRSEIEISDSEMPEKVARNDLESHSQVNIPTSPPPVLSTSTAPDVSIIGNDDSGEPTTVYDLSDDQQANVSESETTTDNLILPQTSTSLSNNNITGTSPSVSSNSTTKLTSVTPSTSGTSSSQPSNSGCRTPVSLKNTLKQLRIEKSANALNPSGRKMWSEEETRCLIRIWEEESARVWASAGKKMLSLKRISDLLIVENIDRDISQVEGKIKALKRDYKAVKQDKAIPAIQTKMAPYLDKLDAIFSREELL